MSTLRNTSRKKINEVLQLTGFSLRDFKIELDPSPNVFIHISFLPYQQYFFEIVERDFAPKGGLSQIMNPSPERSDIGVATIESPGENKTKELKRHQSIDQCIQSISQWGKRIGEELSVTLVENEISDNEQQIEKQIEDFVNNLTGDISKPFSEIEIQEMRSKLESIFTKFEDLEKKHEITEQELENLRLEFENLKKTIQEYPKGVWVKTTIHKLWDFTTRFLKSKEGRELIFEAGRKMLE